MPIRCRTNWCESARDTPEMPNQNTTCSSGEAWPVFIRSWMKSRMASGGTRPARISPQTSPGVFGV